jgi:hypothetical protein
VATSSDPRGRRPREHSGADRSRKGDKREGSLADFFANSALRGANLDLTRLKDPPREIDFGECSGIQDTQSEN